MCFRVNSLRVWAAIVAVVPLVLSSFAMSQMRRAWFRAVDTESPPSGFIVLGLARFECYKMLCISLIGSSFQLPGASSPFTYTVIDLLSCLPVLESRMYH